MFFASNWCEKIFGVSLSLIVIIVALDYHFTLLPLQGGILFTYLFFVIIITTWITFIILQKLLQNNKPFKYSFKESTLLSYVKLLFIKPKNEVAITISNKTEGGKTTKDIDERINDFVRDIEARFVLKWYAHISDDPTFPNECKVLLDEIVRRFLQVVIEVDSSKFVYGCISIFLKHVKEFRKTVKRSQKSECSIEDLYRYSHIGSKSPKAMDYFIHNLTANVLKQFINWELWNSLPCRTLVSILSRRFTTYILTFISAPGFLNHNFIQCCTSSETKAKLNLNSYYFISISDIDHSVKELNSVTIESLTVRKKPAHLERADSDTPKIASRRGSFDLVSNVKRNEIDVVDSSSSLTNGELKELLSTSLDDDEEVEAAGSESTDVKSSENKRKVSEPVKIYNSNSTKTWRNSSDLDCISLGEDMLDFTELNNPDSQIQELIERKLWKDNIDSTEDEKPSTSWDILEPWSKDEETDDGISPSTNFQTYLKSTANTASYLTKPIGNVTANTFHNMKELQQSTVNTVNTSVVKPVSHATSTAMHKIGDLQDEAAGMVEGILDFGIAGIRKGLRLTGLQENFSEFAQKARNEFQKPGINPIDIPRSRKPSDAIKITEKDLKEVKNAAKLAKTPQTASEEKFNQPTTQSSSESDDSVWINPLIKDSPSFDGNILLEKIPEPLRISDACDVIKQTELCDTDDDQKDVPKMHDEFLLNIDSPDPEYEESQDLASTIAKLRSLLQQKSSESGFTTPSLSPMPQFEIDKTPNEPPPNDLTKVDGAMPSLYKFCARTATGVFQNTLNTIKTALPGNVNESNPIVIKHSNEDWTFIEADSRVDDFYYRMKKLLSERREFCTVDTAYEAIDSLEITDNADSWTAPVTTFDDELDEFDVYVPITKALVDIVCELIADTKTCLLQESVVKAVLLIIGHYTENKIKETSNNFLHKVNKCIGKLPENLNQEVMALKMEEMTKIWLEAFPAPLKMLLGDDTLSSGIELFISSLQSQRINQDVCIQMFELFTSQLIFACSQVSPTYSA